MCKEKTKKYTDIIIMVVMVLLYIGFMLGGYLCLDYIFTGKYKGLVPDSSVFSMIAGKDKTIEYVGNIGIGFSVLCVLLMVGISIFMFAFIANGVKDLKNTIIKSK